MDRKDELRKELSRVRNMPSDNLAHLLNISFEAATLIQKMLEDLMKKGEL